MKFSSSLAKSSRGQAFTHSIHIDRLIKVEGENWDACFLDYLQSIVHVQAAMCRSADSIRSQCSPSTQTIAFKFAVDILDALPFLFSSRLLELDASCIFGELHFKDVAKVDNLY